MKTHVLLAAFCIAALAAVVNSADRWPQFRGPESRGVADGANLPTKWSLTENMRWTREIPGRGWSSPVVWGDRVYLTTAVSSGEAEEPKKGLYFGGDRPDAPDVDIEWRVLALDLNSGEILWNQLAHRGKPKNGIHIKNSFASETPVTDGEFVYAYFGNVGVFCYDAQGELIWSKPFPAYKTKNGWGSAASPVLHEHQLIILNDNEEVSYLTSLDKNTGEELWRVSRDEKSNWGTPFIWENSLRTEIVTLGSNKCRAYDLDGKLLYEFGGHSNIAIATPYADDDLLYITSGYVLGVNKPIYAVRPGGSGDITLDPSQDANEFIAWRQKNAGPYNPSTIVYDGLLYVLYDMGLVACYDATTGEEVYGKQRLKKGRAFTASPWAYDGNVFFLNEDGVTFVLKAGREFEILRTNTLGDDCMCMATPAIADDKLLIRTAEGIHCIENAKASP